MKLSSDALRAKAVEVRKDIVKSLYHSQSGHPGGSLSGTDIATALYFNVMNIDPENPKMKGRDKFVLSKGHAAPLLYAVLAERGYFDKEELWGLRKIDSRLQGHPDMKNIPGVEMSTGSLGQGISCAVGMALAGKLDKKCDCCKQPRVYALLGDGELQEGLVWEAAMSAGHYHLDNLTAIVDWNGLQIDGKNDDVMTVRPIDEKFAAFGWDVQLIDGHDMDAILEALEKAAQVKGKPSVIVAKTVKGKGVSFMENNAGWHGKAPNEEQYNQAMAELEAAAAALK